MTVADPDLLFDLDELSNEARRAARDFDDRYANDLQAYRAEISRGLQELLAALRTDVDDLTRGNRTSLQLVDQAAEYVDWLQWTLWDLPYFAVALRPSLDRFRSAVAACGLVYLSIRVFDDIIDRHFWYKGKHPTLLSVATTTFQTGQAAEGLTVLAGLLLCFEGLSRLLDPREADLRDLVQPVLTHVRRAVVGAIMEHTPGDDWDLEQYERLIQLKNVDYWRSLYHAVDPGRSSPLYPFLERHYALAQYLNDVQDLGEDMLRGQPNLVALYMPREPEAQACPAVESTVRRRSPVPAAAEDHLAGVFVELHALTSRLPEPERSIALLKLGESLRSARDLGLFAAEQPADDFEPANGTAEESIPTHFDIRQIIEQFGPRALERVGCSACGSTERNYLFQKQGFAFQRCRVCSHIYVSPRLAAELQTRIGEELEELSPDNPYLEVQRAEAAAICHMLHARAPGPRLLDVGFGRGYLMQVARGLGFEVYGINSSENEVEALRAQFGRHVLRATIGEQDVPGGPFDVVVLSHILEHLAHPCETLRALRRAMSPGALLYVAVPDMESVQFRVFGKKWDVVNPLVHLQYFDRKSLFSLLKRAGFTDVEVVQRPLPPAEIASRWMLLVRRLGGTDTGDLAVLACNPRESH